MIRPAGRTAINAGWEFTPEWTETFARGEGSAQSVTLPHNAGELKLHYCDPADYSFLCGYRRKLQVGQLLRGQRHFLFFEGAAHQAEVFVNGSPAGSHHCGYTAFRVDITPFLEEGENEIAVRLDTREDGAVPPFGYVIDYLTYGGIYRDVFYEVRSEVLIKDLFIMTPKCNLLYAELEAEGTFDELTVRVRPENPAEEKAAAEVEITKTFRAGELRVAGVDEDTVRYRFDCVVPDARLWSPDAPNLYELTAELWKDGKLLDAVSDTFGFREAHWDENSFFLNGKKVFLRGLNRHQSYPYLGYAAPALLQKEDVRILKEELGCNAVRTSHYPQSRYFLDACDRAGLLVFTELPGWQHIGDAAWKEQAILNLRDMILQNRNHPSIILWGVRINESVDDDDFYSRTNALAHALDPTRATSGVRYLERSHLLEDVYAFNDFSHDGAAPGAKSKRAVMKEKDRPLLISEANGHMYPTKSFDTQERRQEHALRHARVLNAAMADGEHAGCFTWCMFDYPTHRDFGSGDRICYHGVLDAWRNPKLAAAVFAAEGAKNPYLAVGSSMDIGDYPAGHIGSVYAFTNADEVKFYKNGNYVTSFTPDRKVWSGLAHPPIAIDDFIGELLVTEEGYDEKKAAFISGILRALEKYGLANLPTAEKLKMMRAMTQYGLTVEDGVALYDKYVGNWGGEATVWRFDAVKDGKTIRSVTKCPGKELHLEADVCGQTVSANECVFCSIEPEEAYTALPIRVRIVDEYGNTASYAQLPVCFSIADGCSANDAAGTDAAGDPAVQAKLATPPIVTAEGGMCGAYIKLPREAKGTVTIICGDLAPVTFMFLSGR